MEDPGEMTLEACDKIAKEAEALNAAESASSAVKALVTGGAIIEVTSSRQARIAEKSGATAVSVLDPATLRGGVARMADPSLIKEIMDSVRIPVIAKCRVGHIVEAQILTSIGVDYIDESELLSIADKENYINKRNFPVHFICGCRDLGEALRRVGEGASIIRTQGDLNRSGDIVETVRNVRKVMQEIRVLGHSLGYDQVFVYAEQMLAPLQHALRTMEMRRMPVVHFAAGGILTPADAALMMQLGCDGVFVGVEVFECSNPLLRIKGIVEAVEKYNDPDVLARVSSGLNQERRIPAIHDDFQVPEMEYRR